jgi:hypothetical protein
VNGHIFRHKSNKAGPSPKEAQHFLAIHLDEFVLRYLTVFGKMIGMQASRMVERSLLLGLDDAHDAESGHLYRPNSLSARTHLKDQKCAPAKIEIFASHSYIV